MNLQLFDNRIREVYPNVVNITEVCIINDLDKETKKISKGVIESMISNMDYVFTKNYNMVYEFVLDLYNEFHANLKDFFSEIHNKHTSTRVIGVIVLREFVDNISSLTRKKLREDWKFQREGADDITYDLIEMMENIVMGVDDFKQVPTRKRMGNRIV